MSCIIWGKGEFSSNSRFALLQLLSVGPFPPFCLLLAPFIFQLLLIVVHLSFPLDSPPIFFFHFPLVSGITGIVVGFYFSSVSCTFSFTFQVAQVDAYTNADQLARTGQQNGSLAVAAPVTQSQADVCCTNQSQQCCTNQSQQLKTLCYNKWSVGFYFS